MKTQAARGTRARAGRAALALGAAALALLAVRAAAGVPGAAGAAGFAGDVGSVEGVEGVEGGGAGGAARATRAPQPRGCRVRGLQGDEVTKGLRARELVRTRTEPSVLLRVHPVGEDEHVSGGLVRDGLWEGHLWKHLERELRRRPGSVFVDIGANIGMYSVLAAAMGHRVVAFEPLKRNVEKICGSLADNGLEDKVRLYYSALSNVSGEYVAFRRHARNVGGTSVVGRDAAGVRGAYGEDYSTTIMLDDVARDLAGETLVVKMDIEGSECRAIAGGLRALSDARSVDILLTEWFQVAARCPDPEQYLRHLRSVGLQPYTVDGRAREGDARFWRDNDLMFRSAPPDTV